MLERIFPVFCLLAFALIFYFALKIDPAKAGTVTSTQDVSLGGTGGLKIDASVTTCAAPHWTGWIYVSTMRSVTFDVDYTVGGAGTAPTGWTARCETSRVNTTLDDAGRDLPAVSTACLAGACTGTIGTMTWQRTSAATEAWTFVVDAIPAPYINCLFTCTGAPDADDTLNVYARGVTP